jgi:hypothetical protein
MGLRFRRSIRIMPGVRLNFSARGLSTTLGPRGASISVGPRGTFANMGLAGTGLSYRTRLSAGEPASNHTTDEPLYLTSRSTARQRKQQEREALRAMAKDLHSEREEQLLALRNILRHRSTDSIDWLEEYGSRGAYQHRPFVAPEQDFTPNQLRAEVAQANPLNPWIVTAFAALACALLAPQLWLRIPSLLLALYFFAQAVQLFRTRPLATSRLLESKTAELARTVAAARKEHEEMEAQNAKRHEQEEALRTRIREAVVRDDSEILASVLEVELSNEDLPFPFDVDVEFDGVKRVQLDLELPTLDVIPATVSTVTKAGKFSERKMAQRDRVDLYKDVCSGLALRLIHEVFRVLPFVEHVEVKGIMSAPDPATGQPSRYVVLRLATDRAPFLSLALDQVDASEAMVFLGGEMKIKRDGTLQPLELSHGD